MTTSVKKDQVPTLTRKMASINKPPHVLIIGAGLGGLTLAQCLRKQGITFDIFERDDSEEARSQGWAIGLHS
jgi:2-polyprenyl-6-methoxyphenol hydroxylase-like FAD-dependent oxidoreductase